MCCNSCKRIRVEWYITQLCHIHSTHHLLDTVTISPQLWRSYLLLCGVRTTMIPHRAVVPFIYLSETKTNSVLGRPVPTFSEPTDMWFLGITISGISMSSDPWKPAATSTRTCCILPFYVFIWIGDGWPISWCSWWTAAIFCFEGGEAVKSCQASTPDHIKNYIRYVVR